MKKLSTLLLAALLALSTVSAAFAVEDEGKEAGSLSVLNLVNGRPAAGVEFSIYHVADREMDKFVWNEQFAEYQLALDEEAEAFGTLPTTLSVYIARDRVEATATAKAGEDGVAVFDEVEPGLYLLTGSSYRSGGYHYEVVPALIVLPFIEQGGHELIWQADIEVKHEAHYIPVTPPPTPTTPPVQTPETVSRHVLKVWEDDGVEQDRPQEIEVQLLNGGEVVSTVTLSAANDWRYTWTGLDKDGEWFVVENNVPEHYEVEIEQQGMTFVLTNSYVEELPEDPQTPRDEIPDVTETPDPEVTPEPMDELPDPEVPKGELPHTGQLWMPVFICAGLGITMVLSGLVVRRKSGGMADD